MTDKRYYSLRTGKNPYSNTLDLEMLLVLFDSVYRDFSRRGYFQEAFGYYCVDQEWVPGTLGPDIQAVILRRLRKTSLWPVEQLCASYSEEDLFDVLEFLYDFVSRPTHGEFHSWMNCGWHYDEFEQEPGQAEIRDEINDLLKDYGGGYILSEDGEILALGQEEMRPLLQQEPPDYDAENVDSRVKSAVHKFRYHTASADDKRQSVRQLADVLEFLRLKLKGVLPSKDEGDLFNIANNFAIRHHNPAQKTQYDEGIWLDWIFYCYLNTIYVSVNLLKRAEESSQ